MELGEKLRLARLEAGLSQRALCGDEITRNMLSAGKRHIHLLFSSLSDNFITRVRIHSPYPPWHKKPWLGNGHPSHKGVSVHTGFSAKPGGPV